jgi:hypothetical protein
VVKHKVLQHTDSLVEWTHSVVLRDTVLLQEVILSVSFCGVHPSEPAYLEHLSDLQSDLVALSQSTLSDKLDNLGEILLLLQNLLGSRSQIDETRVDFLVVGIEDFEVFGV